jgi:parallel beta-helix repeat protein
MAFDIQRVEALATVYIMPDGTVNPPSAPIWNLWDAIYTFTDNISASLVVQRDNIEINGAGYALQGAGTGTGIDLTGRSNVIVDNVAINNFQSGIYLSNSTGNTLDANTITDSSTYGVYLYRSSGNTISANNIKKDYRAFWNPTGVGIYLYSFSGNNSISENTIANNTFGIRLENYANNNSITRNTITNTGHVNNGSEALDWRTGISLSYSTSNIISANIIASNTEYGINLEGSNSNILFGNTLTNRTYQGITLYLSTSNTLSANTIANGTTEGIILSSSTSNSLYGNTLTNCSYGLNLRYSSLNLISHNNFVGNTYQVQVTPGYSNTWDEGYPSGGNYWSTYNGTDSNHDGFGDTTYVIDANNVDHYPLVAQYVVPELPSFLVAPMFFGLTLLAFMVHRKKRLNQ